MDIEKYLEDMLKACPAWVKGTTIVVACSGGADSLALTDLVAYLAPGMDIKAKVLHVEHHLRGDEAEADAKLVEEFCHRSRLEFKRVDVDVNKLVEEEGLSVEEGARKLRYQALEEYRREVGASAIFLAHHRDDQAETVLLNLVRGAGTRGLRGMLPLNGYLVRPLLQATRKDLEEYCASRGLTYCQDSTNSDITYKRNWVRKKLLPLLETVNPNIRKQLAQAAALAAADEEYLDSQAKKFVQAFGRQVFEMFDIGVGKDFQALPLAVKTRVLRIVITKAGGREISFEHIRDLLELIDKGVGNKAMDFPGKARIVYLNSRLMAGPNNNSRSEERQKKIEQKERQRNECKPGENSH